VAHQVLVGVAEDVVALGAVGAEVEPGVLEDGDEVGEAVDHFLAAPELVGVVEVGEGDDALEIVGVGEPADDLVADFLVALERDHIAEAAAGRDLDEGLGLARVAVRDVFDEEEDEDVVLVLGGVHPAAELVAARPEGGVELGFLDGHRVFLSYR